MIDHLGLTERDEALLDAPPVWACIEHAMDVPELAARAQVLFDERQGIFAEHAVELSASDAGRCVLEKWAHLHGKFDLPENYTTRLAKMDAGTLMGLRLATLFKVGFRDIYGSEAVAALEVESEHDGIPGHVDIVAYRHNRPWVIEIKTSLFGGVFSGPADYQVIQAAKYALGQGADGFTVFSWLPAATKRGGQEARHYAQTDYLTADWAERVRAEYARLRAAQNDDPPQADAKEPWRCLSCRYSACERNQNPLREVPF